MVSDVHPYRHLNDPLLHPCFESIKSQKKRRPIKVRRFVFCGNKLSDQNRVLIRNQRLDKHLRVLKSGHLFKINLRRDIIRK